MFFWFIWFGYLYNTIANYSTKNKICLKKSKKEKALLYIANLLKY